MQVAPGTYVSNTSTDDWASDPDVPGTEMHELLHEGGVWAGLTRILDVDGPISWTPPQRETIHVLEGAVRIETAGNVVLDLGPGDIASLPGGVPTTWHVTVPFKEFWVLA